MMDSRSRQTLRRAAVIAILPVTLFVLNGCAGPDDDLPSLVNEETAETDEVLEEVSEPAQPYADYTGVYDTAFFDDLEFYVGEEVTIAAIVGEVISPNMFTLVSNTVPPEEDVVDIDAVIIKPLLVIHQEDLPELAPGMPVGVIGEVHEEFYPATVEQDLQVDLDNDAFEDWEEQAYLEAASAASLATD
ncbi:hypothetical protein [Arthrobacter sp. TB 23]|uniref:hypothetical protein n=1 Tax=Arthrobacter sp. TB 23 TaxID=494419 RepID=UPI00037BF8A1|nr:hypothetical protein [Arthrobacter sp. TB 23]